MHLKMLIWKDFRQQSGFLAGTVVVLLVPFLIALVAHLTNRFSPHRVQEWYRFYPAAAIADVALSAVLLSFFAGNAIAGERGDRSAEFFAALPIQKTESVLSKLVVALGLSLLVLSVSVGLVGAMTLPFGESPLRNQHEQATAFFATCAAMFTVAWGVSSFARSATYAAAAGVSIPICLAVTIATIADQTAGERAWGPEVYLWLAAGTSVVSFIAGTVYYLRRVEP